MRWPSIVVARIVGDRLANDIELRVRIDSCWSPVIRGSMLLYSSQFRYPSSSGSPKHRTHSMD